MKFLLSAEKTVRRLLILALVIFLVLRAVEFIPRPSGDGRSIEALQKDGPVTKYSLHQKMNLDGDAFTLKELYVTSKEIVIHYSLRRRDPGGWSFSSAGLKLYDADGNELARHSSSSGGQPWGETGFIYFDPMKNAASKLTLKYEWYDRHNEMQILLHKDGDGE